MIDGELMDIEPFLINFTIFVYLWGAVLFGNFIHGRKIKLANGAMYTLFWPLVILYAVFLAFPIRSIHG